MELRPLEVTAQKYTLLRPLLFASAHSPPRQCAAYGPRLMLMAEGLAFCSTNAAKPLHPNQLPAIAVHSRTGIDQRDQPSNGVTMPSAIAPSARAATRPCQPGHRAWQSCRECRSGCACQWTGVLGFLIERQIQFLLSRSMLPVPTMVVTSVSKISASACMVPSLTSKSATRTQLDELVTGNFQLQHFPQMQADFSIINLLISPPATTSPTLPLELAACAYRVTFSARSNSPLIWPTLVLLKSTVGNNLAMRFFSPAPGVRLDRILAPIQRNHRIEVAAGHAEIQRIECQHGIAQAQMGNEVFKRQFLGASDGLGLQCYLRVDAVQRSVLNGKSGSTRACTGVGAAV